MVETNLKSVFVDELRDLHNAEQQLIKALPKMAKAATSEELRKGFEEHLEQTKEHAARIEKIFGGLGEPVKGKKCKGMGRDRGGGRRSDVGRLRRSRDGCSDHFRRAKSGAL